MLGVIGSLFGSASKLTGFGEPSDDDFVDRLNHSISTFIITLFALVVTTKQFAGDPIKCAMGKDYDHGQWVDYTNNLCWIGNTYNVPFPEVLPVEEKERQMREIKYYQWVPIILLIMALLFKIPNVIWKSLNPTVGLNMEKIISMAESTQLNPPDERDETIKNIARSLNTWLIFKRERQYNIFSRMRTSVARFKILCFPLGIRNGTYLVGLYLFVKLCYFAVSVGQFYMLNSFLAMDFTMYGFEVAEGLIQTGELQESWRFPKITYCDIKVRQMQNVNTHTFQCVLSINLISEKIFAFLWFWLLALAFANAFSFCVWLYNVVFRRNRVQYVEKYLALFVDITEDKGRCRKFVDEYLRDDGVFVLRVVANNSSIMVLTDLITHLWKLYRNGPFWDWNERDKRKQENRRRQKMEMSVMTDRDGNGATTFLM